MHFSNGNSSNSTKESAFLAQRQQVIDWLVANNYPALPVAPAQSADKYPKRNKAGQIEYDNQGFPLPLFTGKNPSYLDQRSIPHLVNHRRYQKQLPCDKEIGEWFVNPANGVGTLGGWNNTIWLDFDVKQFPSQDLCDAAVTALLEHPELQNTTLERTHSGGWRIGVRVSSKPNFTNFALTPGGSHVGEALGEGRFTVLAPTIGPSGNSYQSINRAVPKLVTSLESIGIYSTSTKKKADSSTTRPRALAAIPGSIPLEMLGNDTSRDILKGTNHKGDRSEALATAVQEWYGWQNWGHNNGIAILGSAEDLAHHAGSLLGIDSDRVDRILKTVDPGNCHPAALHRGGEESCWKKIARLDKGTFESHCPAHIKDGIKSEWGHSTSAGGSASGLGSSRLFGEQFSSRSGGNGGSGDGGSGGDEGNGKIIKHPAFSPLTPEALIQEINTLIDAALDSSQISAQIPVLAKRANYSDRAVWKIYYDRLREIEQESERFDTAAMIDALLLAVRAKVDLHDVLPLALAEPLSRLSGWLNMRPETVLVTLLTTASALHHPQTTSVLNRDWDFDVKPNLYAAIVAPPSQKKSPILKAIARKPLRVLEKKAREAYKAALTDYNEQEARYKRLSEDKREAEFPSGLPEPPPSRRKVYSFTKTTSEGLREQVAAYPQQGLLALPDELASLIKGANQYRNGRGSDEEDLLSFYDGLGETVLRADGVAGDFDNLLLGILGTIQPVVLQGFLKDCKDSNGKWSRFMFVNQPLAASTMSADGGTFDLTPMLASLYEKINTLPAVDYYPEQEAFQYYCEIYNELERRRVADPSPGMSAAWGKAEGRIGKIALNLHVIHELMAGQIPGQFIPKARYQEATLITLFSMQQVFYLYNELGESDALATHLTKVINLSRKKNAWITARDVQLTYDKDSRPTPDAVRSWFRELEAMGKGVTEGLGRNLRFNQEVGFVGGSPTNSPTATTTEASNEKPFVGVVGECGVFLEKTHPLALTHNSVEASSQFFQNLPTIPTNSTNALNVERIGDMAVGEAPTFSPTTPTSLDNPDPDDTPPDGSGGGVSHTPGLSDPTGDGGVAQQLLTSEEVGTWVDLAAACQTLEDAIAFDKRLSVLPNHQQTQICEATPDLIKRLWQLPEAAEIHEEPPTLAQLEALLLACQTLSALQALKVKHTPKRVSEAYKALSDEQQLHIDGLSANAVEYPVFKYVGQSLKVAGQTLVSRALVYIEPNAKIRDSSTTVPVWGLGGFGQGWKEPLQVSHEDLVPVEKIVPQKAIDGDQFGRAT